MVVQFLAVVLLSFGLDLVSGIWTDYARDKDTCFTCEKFSIDKVSAIIETSNQTIARVNSEIGTRVESFHPSYWTFRATTDMENVFIARKHDTIRKDLLTRHSLSGWEFVMPYAGRTGEKTTEWLVYHPGAIFLDFHAACNVTCRSLRLPSTEEDKSNERGRIYELAISGVGKFQFTPTEKCVPEDYYVYTGGERVPSIITLSHETLVTGYIQRNITNELLGHSLFSNTRNELRTKFKQSASLRPSNATGVDWQQIDFPTFQEDYRKYPDDPHQESGSSSEHYFTLVGVCGEYKINTGRIYKRHTVGNNKTLCSQRPTSRPGTIEDCGFCNDGECIKGEKPDIF